MKNKGMQSDVMLAVMLLLSLDEDGHADGIIPGDYRWSYRGIHK